MACDEVGCAAYVRNQRFHVRADWHGSAKNRRAYQSSAVGQLRDFPRNWGFIGLSSRSIGIAANCAASAVGLPYAIVLRLEEEFCNQHRISNLLAG